MTAPLPDRLRAAAETIEEMNARDGLDTDMSISASYLRAEAEQMEER